ncbi:MAG TPA: hypothetical protein VGM88_24005 [Kofleriaceae bacterium]|jgi:hypothetical protein
MGALDERAFLAALGPCTCGARAYEVKTYIDRQVPVMLADESGEGRFMHDGEKLIDGVYEIRCTSCGALPFSDARCPRCHAADGLSIALASPSRLPVPRRCPSCASTELLVMGFVPATVRAGEGRPSQPSTSVAVGDDGFAMASILCDGCDWVAVSDGCPLCGAPPPLRKRP